MENSKNQQPESHGRVFVAGASGIIGRRMCELLVADGFIVAGTTRSPDKVPILEAIGVEPLVVDVFDTGKLRNLPPPAALRCIP